MCQDEGIPALRYTAPPYTAPSVDQFAWVTASLLLAAEPGVRFSLVCVSHMFETYPFEHPLLWV